MIRRHGRGAAPRVRSSGSTASERGPAPGQTGASPRRPAAAGLLGLLVLILVGLLARSPVHGADPETFAGSLLKATTGDPADQEQNKAAGPGWFWNLGPTGIRAMLVDKSGKCQWEGDGTCFLVKYVFPKSPADGKVLPGDTIIGANAKRFSTVYKLGYWFGIGYDGPPMEMGQAIEESESGKGGKLDLLILRKEAPVTVTVQIESKGAFSATFPFGCKKSDQLLREACAYLVKVQDKQGMWGAPDADVDACLALLAQGPQYHPMVEKYLDRALAGIGPGTWNWQLALNSILVSEYTLITRNERYVKHMLRFNELLKANQCPNATYGHMGYAVRDPGFYGPMCGCSSLCCLGWSLLERAGIPIHKDYLDKTMVEMDMALQGEGYPYGWSNEACQKTSVLSEEQVTKALTAIKKPVHALSGARGGALPLGAMALVHHLRPWKAYSGLLAANHLVALARARGGIVNGHGSGYIHACWGLLAAGCMGNGTGVDDPFRVILDYYKPYLNLARCGDGSFYTQPTRDDMNGDYGRSTRNLPTAVWALVLSVPKRTLLVQGRNVRGKAKAGDVLTSSSKPNPEADAAGADGAVRTEAKPPAPQRKPAGAEALKEWDGKLKAAVASKLQAGTRPKFVFSAVGGPAEIVSLDAKGEMKLNAAGSALFFSWTALQLDDKRALASGLAAGGEPGDDALAAFYSLAAGNEKAAEPYLRRLGEKERAAVDASFP